MTASLLTTQGQVPGVTINPERIGSISLGADRTLIVARDGSSAYATLKDAVDAIGTTLPAASSTNRYAIILRQSQSGGDTTLQENNPIDMSAKSYISIRGEGGTSITCLNDDDGIIIGPNISLENVRIKRTTASSANKVAFKFASTALNSSVNKCAFYNFDIGWLNESANAGIQIDFCYVRQGATSYVVKNNAAGALTAINSLAVYGSVVVNTAVLEDSIGGTINCTATDVSNDDTTSAYSINMLAHVNNAASRISMDGFTGKYATTGLYAEEGDIVCSGLDVQNCGVGAKAKLGTITGFGDFDTNDTYNLQTTNASGTIDIQSAKAIDWSLISTFAGSTLRVNQIQDACRVSSTGLVNGGVITQNGGDVHKFDISDGFGIVVNNYTDPADPTLTRVEWSGLSAILDLYVHTDAKTYIGIDAVGAVTQQNSMFTAIQLRSIIYLGYTGHEAMTQINYLVPQPIVAYEPGIQFNTYIMSIGPQNISGNDFSANGANLKVDRAPGVVYAPGIGYTTDRRSPNRVATSVDAALTLQTAWRTAGGAWTASAVGTAVDPDNYDPGGGAGKIAVNLTKFTIQRIYWLPYITYGSVVVALGQVEYADMPTAVANVNTPVVEPDFVTGMIFRGWLIVEQGTAALNNAAKAKFISAMTAGGSSGGGGGGGEANTGANVGLAGVGPYDGKAGVVLDFKNIDAGSNKITVTDVPAQKTIEIDVDPSNIDVNDLNGPIDDTMHGNRGAGLHADSHTRSHAITSSSDHTSAATPGKILKADANGLPVDASNTDAQVAGAVSISHNRQHDIASTSDHSSTATSGKILKADANGLPANASNTDVEVAAAVAASHAQSHSITSAANHSSTATPGQMLKANASGLPVDGTNTDVQVAAAVSASHARQHAMDSGSDHSAGTQGDIMYAGAAGAWTRLGAGNSGQLLKTNGAAANPGWTNSPLVQSLHSDGTNQTVTSASYGAMTAMSITITKLAGTKLKVTASVAGAHSSSNQTTYFQIYDSTSVVAYHSTTFRASANNGLGGAAVQEMISGLAAGTYTIQLRSRTTGGTFTMNPATDGHHACLIVEELAV